MWTSGCNRGPWCNRGAAGASSPAGGLCNLQAGAPAPAGGQKSASVLTLPRTKRYDPFWIFICIVFCFRYDTVSGRPSRIQPLKWPIFEQIPSIFGWDMTQNILFPFWVISQPKVDGFCSNMGHFKGWILLGRPDTVSYRKHYNEHNTEPVSPSRIFFIVPKLAFMLLLDTLINSTSLYRAPRKVLSIALSPSTNGCLSALHKYTQITVSFRRFSLTIRWS